MEKKPNFGLFVLLFLVVFILFGSGFAFAFVRYDVEYMVFFAIITFVAFVALLWSIREFFWNAR